MSATGPSWDSLYAAWCADAERFAPDLLLLFPALVARPTDAFGAVVQATFAPKGQVRCEVCLARAHQAADFGTDGRGVGVTAQAVWDAADDPAMVAHALLLATAHAVHVGRPWLDPGDLDEACMEDVYDVLSRRGPMARANRPRWHHRTSRTLPQRADLWTDHSKGFALRRPEDLVLLAVLQGGLLLGHYDLGVRLLWSDRGSTRPATLTSTCDAHAGRAPAAGIPGRPQ